MYVIESRLHADNRYVRRRGRKTADGACVPHSVVVRGHKGKAPTRTAVAEEDHAWLMDDPGFQQHVANGSLIVNPVEVPVFPGQAAIEPEELPAASPPASEEDESAASVSPAAEEKLESALSKAPGKEPAKAANGKKVKQAGA